MIYMINHSMFFNITVLKNIMDYCERYYGLLHDVMDTNLEHDNLFLP